MRFYIFCLFISCTKSDISSYIYPQPLPPAQFDEPSTPAPVYLPPLQDEEFLPPPVPPSPTYLPPNLYPPLGSDDTVVIPAYPPQIRILNMSCMMDTFFRCLIRAQTSQMVVDNAPESCIVPEFGGNTFRIDVDGGRMSECGVKRCKDTTSRTNMCLTVRMPTIRRLKLPEDGLVTLQCTPQENIVSQVKQLRLNPNSNLNARARSNGLIATGGAQRDFRTRVSLLKKSPNGNDFDQLIQSGSGVQLGEELALKASIQDGDGWQYGRIGAVIIRSASLQRSLTLVDENGCRPVSLKSICPLQPRQITPLVTVVNFRAFLFQEAAQSDDMTLSVRILGCLQQRDCQQKSVCDGGNFRFRQKRAKEIDSNYSTDEEFTNWESLEFRVFTNTQKNDLFDNINKSSYLHQVLIIALLCSLLFLLITCCIIIYCKH